MHGSLNVQNHGLHRCFPGFGKVYLGFARKLVDKYTKNLNSVKNPNTSRYIVEYFCHAIGNTGLINPIDRFLVFWPVNLS